VTGAAPTDTAAKPVVLLTGATGNLGRSIADHLAPDYRVIGLDRSTDGSEPFRVIEADLSDAEDIGKALDAVQAEVGDRIASVVHLAAYFDFSGEAHPLYEALNVAGTRALLEQLRTRFTVEQFVHASTMLVHAPCSPGERIDEDAPIEPRWAYPQSKARAEQAVRAAAGDVPIVILRLAGIYDERSMVPTLAHQIARIADRDLQSRFYPGDMDAGQSMLHRDDMLDAVRRAVDRRTALPPDTALLIGEPDPLGYGELQDRIGCLVHGEDEWTTLPVPKPLAEAGAWLQDRIAPVVPDAIAEVEAPFVKPFMVRMADDHYALDISRARDLLGWTPRHRLADTLPAMIARFRADRAGWEKINLA
jgi:nucleoside-diphosphate-sugar epimerase